MLTDLLVPPERAAQLRAESQSWRSLDLSPRQLCDLELLLNGSFTPLRGFMTRGEYESVTQNARLSDGTIWPTPVTFDLAAAIQQPFQVGERVALRDQEGVMLAALDVEDVWDGPAGQRHLGGCVEGVQLPTHHDFTHLRKAPAQVQQEFADAGWSRIAVFQAHSSAPPAALVPVFDAARQQDAALFVHLITGVISSDDRTHYARVRAYDEMLRGAGRGAAFAILPLWVEARTRAWTLRAMVAKNFGGTHLLVTEDIPADARKHSWEIGIELVTIAGSAASAAASHSAAPADGRRQQGFTVFFTGLSGSGKSTVANALLTKLLEAADRTVSLLDGDIVRKHLSSELGFSKEHRDLNVRRIAYVASEITKHGGIAICAPIAPYDEVRTDARHMIEAHGAFILVHLSTSLEVCERRDRKGLYAKARAGVLPQFTGISDPYEAPEDAAITIDTEALSADAAAALIMEHLKREGYLAR